MNTYIPLIETDRLILRAYTREDFPAMLRLYQHPIATKYVPPGPISRESCWSLWLQYHGLWAAFGFGYWAINEKSSGAYIGEIGFSDFQRQTVPPMPDLMEIGIILHPDYHRRGYGYEAECAIMAWQEQHFARPVCCLVLPENLASLNLLKKCGFVFEQQLDYASFKVDLGIRQTPASGTDRLQTNVCAS